MHSERVDYLLLRKHDWDGLVGYLDILAKVSVGDLPRDEQLAFYINLYNATMVNLIVDRMFNGFSPAAEDYRVFKESLVRLRVRRVSLNDLENKIIRKKILTALGLQHVRIAGSGSAPIAGELIHWYRDLGLELLEAYGMSENFSFSHISIPGKSRVGYVGNTYPGVECKISDAGEILVKSPADMLGYYLLLAPPIIYLYRRLRDRGSRLARMVSAAGFLYVTVGTTSTAPLYRPAARVFLFGAPLWAVAMGLWIWRRAADIEEQKL